MFCQQCSSSFSFTFCPGSQGWVFVDQTRSDGYKEGDHWTNCDTVVDERCEQRGYNSQIEEVSMLIPNVDNKGSLFSNLVINHL